MSSIDDIGFQRIIKFSIIFVIFIDFLLQIFGLIIYYYKNYI